MTKEGTNGMLERFRKRAVYLLRKMNPPQIIVLMFLAVILTGASVLTLPASSAAGMPRLAAASRWTSRRTISDGRRSL